METVKLPPNLNGLDSTDGYFDPYRYWLWYYTMTGATQANSEPLIWVGLNPSTALATEFDPTARRMWYFTQKFGYDNFVILNLFAFRATDPRKLPMPEVSVGPRNNYYLESHTESEAGVVCCWGRHAKIKGRAKEVLEILRPRKTYALHINEDGSPAHPLYQPGYRDLIPYPNV